MHTNKYKKNLIIILNKIHTQAHTRMHTKITVGNNMMFKMEQHK